MLEFISKPPGTATASEGFRVVPRLVPPPKCHTLRVKHSDRFARDAFGDLLETNLQMTLVAHRVTDRVVTTRQAHYVITWPSHVNLNRPQAPFMPLDITTTVILKAADFRSLFY